MMDHFKYLLYVILLANSLAMPGQGHYTAKRTHFSMDEYNEFSPFITGDKIVFCSNKVNNLIPIFTDKNKKGYFSIFSIQLKDSTSGSDPELFSIDLITPYNDGPIAFDGAGKKAVFSRNNNINSNKSDIFDPKNTLGLFLADLVDGEWKNIEPFTYNNKKYNNTTPFLSPDGKYLYFTSDMPGGYGGTDLYRSENIDGNWTKPENLGGIINTKGNEICPFVNASGELFFASDGHPGLGKKDIYLSIEKKEGWITPVHLDPPINSKHDDLSLITDGTFTSGYFASDRYRSDDIFGFETLLPQLYNCDTLKPNNYCFEFWDENYAGLDSLPVTYEWAFSDGTNERGLRVEHCFPKKGKYSVDLNIVDNNTSNIFFTQFSMDVELDDHEQPFINSGDASLINDEIKFNGLSSNLPGFTIEEYAWDFGDGNFTAGSEASHTYTKPGVYNVKLGVSGYDKTNKAKAKRCVFKPVTIVSEKQALSMFLSAEPAKIAPVDTTKSTQNFSVYDINPDEKVFRVEILSSEEKIRLKDTIFDPLRDIYEIKEFYRADDSIYSYTVGESKSLPGVYGVYNDVVNKGFTRARVKTYVLAELPTEVVAKINRDFADLADANFDFDQTIVAETSYPLLDKIVKIMEENPELVMEISAHTDDIGSFEYNMQLSQSRAQSIVDYLVSRGIKKQRLVAKGYGESRAISTNNTEEGRMLNRRVEFTILNKQDGEIKIIP